MPQLGIATLLCAYYFTMSIQDEKLKGILPGEYLAENVSQYGACMAAQAEEDGDHGYGPRRWTAGIPTHALSRMPLWVEGSHQRPDH